MYSKYYYMEVLIVIKNQLCAIVFNHPPSISFPAFPLPPLPPPPSPSLPLSLLRQLRRPVSFKV